MAQSTAFTYQGKLTDVGNPANGNYDLRFRLFDALSTGAQQGATLVRNPVTTIAGNFTVTLDFSANVFAGADRFLEIGVRPTGSSLAYTVLAPRQPITSTPYAIQTINTQQLGGLPASRYVASDDAGNVGIGVAANAGMKLDVNGPVLFRPGGSGGGLISFHTPNSETGFTINGNGTNRADLRFDGATLKLVATSAGIPPLTNGLAINTLGNVGIGVAPQSSTRLRVNSVGLNDGLFVQSDLGAITGSSNLNGTGVYGISSSGIGVEGFSNGGNNFGVFATGYLGMTRLGAASFPNTPLCLNGSNQISNCGSSLRYKTDLRPYGGGMNVINRLQPITFKWRSEGRTLDVGFGAEAVAEVEPLFITRNDKGEVEGVKYDRLSVVFVNAFKEQQVKLQTQARRIATQHQQLKELKQQLDALRKLVCATQPQVAACQE